MFIFINYYMMLKTKKRIVKKSQDLRRYLQILKNEGESKRLKEQKKRKKDLRRFLKVWEPCYFTRYIHRKSMKMLSQHYDKLMGHIEEHKGKNISRLIIIC